MAKIPAPGSIDEYIAGFPPEIQGVLRELRALVRECAPGVIESISYAIPTFDLNGRHLVWFAAYPRHIGFYLGASGVAEFKDEIAPYKSAKGSVQFPLGKPMPAELIRRIVEFRVAENEARTAI